MNVAIGTGTGDLPACSMCGDPASSEINAEPVCTACADGVDLAVCQAALDEIAGALTVSAGAGAVLAEVRRIVAGTGREV